MNKYLKITLISLGLAALIALIILGISRGTKGDYDINAIVPASSASGDIAEHVEGPLDAPVVIIEYSDFQCSACASHVDLVTELVEKYAGKLAVVHRTYTISYHPNAFAAACAAEAAGLQSHDDLDYWKVYGDYLYKNQAEWYYSDETERTQLFTQYFADLAEDDDALNLDQFLSDFTSNAVSKKVNFDLSLANRNSAIDSIQYTPAFYLDGKIIDFAYDNPDNLSFIDYLSRAIDEKLSSLENS
ncbi:thioredoxin domain-containing protein [Candidatus Saccharibacteria bacterium]|nr:thioredoxin domain-containing protein [Candidatus Saccharibacteria bacterium]